MHAIEQVYSGKDNVITLVLSEDGVPISNHTQFTRAVLTVGIPGIFHGNQIAVFDSQIDSSLFDLTNQTDMTISLGAAAVPTGRFLCELTVFTAQAPNGVVWEPKMEINFS